MAKARKDPNAVALGRKGVLARSEVKTKAARKNARRRWALAAAKTK
jgi:hypothetical protein